MRLGEFHKDRSSPYATGRPDEQFDLGEGADYRELRKDIFGGIDIVGGRPPALHSTKLRAHEIISEIFTLSGQLDVVRRTHQPTWKQFSELAGNERLMRLLEKHNVGTTSKIVNTFLRFGRLIWGKPLDTYSNLAAVNERIGNIRQNENDKARSLQDMVEHMRHLREDIPAFMGRLQEEKLIEKLRRVETGDTIF